MIQFLKKRQKDETNHDSQVDQGSIDFGEGSSESVEPMSQQELLERLDQLNREFKEFETIREDIRIRIDSIAVLVPRLHESKYLLQKEIDEKRNVMQQLDSELPALNQQKEFLLQSLSQKQDQQARVKKQIRLEQDRMKETKRLIAKLTHERTKTEKIIQQKQDEIATIDDQIKQIKSVQEYDVDIGCTSLYAHQKR